MDREGGYVNDPDNPGGATNFGVTIHTMRRLGLDFDHDGDVDKHDVQMLSRAHAVDLFIKHYFEGLLIAQLPQPLQATVFYMYVNAGCNAVRILQRLLINMVFEVVVDGALGPQSIASVQTAFETVGGLFDRRIWHCAAQSLSAPC